MPTIVFEVKDASGNELTAVRVTIDGELLASHLEGTAISLDPGEHTFAFAAEGQPKVEKKLVVHEGEKERHEVISLDAAPTESPEAAGPQPGSSRPLDVPSPPSAESEPRVKGSKQSETEQSDEDGRGTRRMWGLIIGGIGAASGIASFVFMGQGANENGVIKTGFLPNSAAIASADSHGSTDNVIAVTSGILGIGGVVVGGALFLLNLPHHDDLPGRHHKAGLPYLMFSPRADGFVLSGEF
jgi:hypothetical protein